jgi:hypothetical protein
MKLTKIVRKSIAAGAALFVIAMSFTSCQREGCPGQITKVNTVKTVTNC